MMVRRNKPETVNIKWSCFRCKGMDERVQAFYDGLKDGTYVDVSGRMRMGRAEQENYLRMMAVTDQLIHIFEQTDNWKRFEKVNRGRQYLKTIITLLLKIDKEFYNLVPCEQLLDLKRQLPYLRVNVHTEDVKEDVKNRDGRWLSFTDLDILAAAVRDQCMMCTCDEEEQKACPYRAVLDKLPVDPPETDGDGCPWMLMFGLE